MVGSTSKITISEKPCVISQTQIDFEITEIIKLIESCQLEDHVYPIQTHD